MKKTIVIASVLLLGLTSCKKEEVKAPAAEPSYSGTATISGVVKAELDITNANKEYAPAGTIILLEYSQEDLVLNPTATTYEIKTVSTKVGSNGGYSATVPTNGKPVAVKVSPQDFEYDQITGPGTTTRVVYTKASTNTSVVNGSHKIIDIIY